MFGMANNLVKNKMNRKQLIVVGIIIVIISIIVLTAPTYESRGGEFVNWSVVFQRIIPVLLIGTFLIYLLKGSAGVFKIFKVTMITFCVVIISGIGTVRGINEINKSFAKSNAKYVVIKNYSVVEIPNKYRSLRLLSDTEYNLVAILKNNSNRLVKRVDLELNYYTPDNYFINRDIINNFTDGSIITPQSESSSISKTVILLSVPNQEHEKRLSVYRVYFW